MIKAEQLKKIVTEILEAYGESKTNASLAADCLVMADLRGVSTHGTYLLIPIFDRIQAGMINIPTKIEIVKDKGAVTIIDGGNGLGQLAARKAMEISIEKAKDFGIAMSSVRNTNNIGFLGYYADIASRNGMIGIIASNAASSIAPWGSKEAFIGTNPFAISIPSKNRKAIILDMSSSVVARGKIRQTQRNKTSIPLDWALDAEGNPTTNPEEALKGTMLPIAGPKGSGLAIIIDILTGMLSGSKYGLDVKTFHKLEGATGVGAFCMVMNIDYFLDLEGFTSQIDDYIDSVKRLKKIKNVSEIFLPGERKFLHEEKAMNEGIEIASSTMEKLNDILSKIGNKLRL